MDSVSFRMSQMCVLTSLMHRYMSRGCLIKVSVIIQEAPQFPGKSTFRAIQIALGNSSKPMCLNILGLASQGERTIDKFPSEGFRLRVLLQSSWRLTVITRPSLKAGSRRSCNGSRFLHVTVLLAFIFKYKVNLAHPFRYRTVGLSAFLLGTISTANDKCLLPEVLIPVFKGNVQWGPRAFATLFIVADQTSHPLLDVLRKPKSNQALSLVRTMSWRLGSKTSNPASRTAAGRVFPAPNTPLIAMPVRPSHKARTTALRVASTWPSASLKRGSIACFSAYRSSFSMLADSRWQTAKVVMQQCATWYVLGA